MVSKIFLVEVDASVYPNDINFIVIANNEKHAVDIIKKYLHDHRGGCYGDAEVTATALKLDEHGIIFEFDPHAGDNGDW